MTHKEYAIKDLKALWRIRHVFYHRIPDLADALEDKIAMLEAQFLKMKSGL